MSKHALDALLTYKQADADGVMVLTSRQAIHEVAEELAATKARLEGVMEGLRRVRGRLASADFDTVGGIESHLCECIEVLLPEIDALLSAPADGAALLCEECGTYPADPPSKLCPGCEAYREHTGAI